MIFLEELEILSDTVFDLLIAPWKTSVLTTAVRLNIFTILFNNQMGVEEISSRSQSNPLLLRPLLDACVSMGLLNLKNDMYSNSHFSRVYLIEGKPYYVGDFIQLLYNESRQWDKLYEIVKNNENYTEEQNSEEAHRTFIKGMNNLGMLGEADALLHSVDLSGSQIMVDAGGGSGLYSVVLCQKYPELRSTILDKRETLDITREMISSHKVSERIKLQECDITKETFGENIDVVLLSDVIYDDSEAESILRNAWNCLVNNGILIVRGYYSDPEDTKPFFGFLFLLNQLVFEPGRNILTITSLQKKISEIGFDITKSSPLTERSFIVIAKKDSN
jgi:2-polyprenyl-3-methyl-5-hydroxy-6-metoxy-1,4-benzoquinol methylase